MFEILMLLSVIYCILSLFFLCVSILINIKFSQKFYNYFLGGLILSLTIIAFFTYPNPGSDLSRYYVELSILKNISLQQALLNSLYSSTPLTTIFFWIIAQVGIFNLLPCLATSISFILIFKVLLEEKKIVHLSNQLFSLFILLFICIFSLRAALTGVRQITSYALLLLAVYIDFFSQKKYTSGLKLFLYLLPVLVHMGTLPYLLLRIIIIFIKDRSKIYLIALWCILIPFFDFLANNSNELIRSSYEKLLGYSEIDYPDIRLLIVKIIVFVLFGYLLHKNKRIYEKKYNQYIRYSLSILCFGIGAFSVPHLFDRTINFFILIGLPFFSSGFHNIDNKRKYIAYVILFVLIFGLLLYWFVDLKSSWRLIPVIYR